MLKNADRNALERPRDFDERPARSSCSQHTKRTRLIRGLVCLDGEENVFLCHCRHFFGRSSETNSNNFNCASPKKCKRTARSSCVKRSTHQACAIDTRTDLPRWRRARQGVVLLSQAERCWLSATAGFPVSSPVPSSKLEPDSVRAPMPWSTHSMQRFQVGVPRSRPPWFGPTLRHLQSRKHDSFCQRFRCPCRLAAFLNLFSHFLPCLCRHFDFGQLSRDPFRRFIAGRLLPNKFIRSLSSSWLEFCRFLIVRSMSFSH